jgi:hypothetical protein
MMATKLYKLTGRDTNVYGFAAADSAEGAREAFLSRFDAATRAFYEQEFDTEMPATFDINDPACFSGLIVTEEAECV